MTVRRGDLAREFASMMADLHDADLACGDERIRDAVIVKMVALTVLAFGIPASREGIMDEDEALMKLKIALHTLKGTE